jgi:hypothetical protein
VKLAHIMPVHYLDAMPDTGYHLILPELVKTYPSYKTHYAGPVGYKILDNGAAENQAPGTKQLMRIAELLEVDEIVIPDALADTNETIRLARRFAATAHANPDYKYMGVLQGRDYAEVIKCAHFFAICDWISVIGVPRLLAEHIHNRVRCTIVEALAEQNDWERFEWHMLGSSRWIVEPVALASIHSVRGMDTSYPSYMATLGKDVATDDWEPRPKSYFGYPYFDLTAEIMRKNLETYGQWAQTGV